MATTELKFIISADSTGAITGIEKVTGGLKNIGIAGEEAGAKGRSAAESFSASMDKLKNVAIAVGGAIVALKIGEFLRSSLEASQQIQTAFMGLSAVSNNLGINATAAKNAAISLTKDGFLNLADASKGLQNLLASGLGLPFATELMQRNKDAAIFNRQAHLGLSESIKVFTDGFKNEISTLTDATGVSTNYARALEDTFKLIKTGNLDFDRYRHVLTEAEIAQVKHAVSVSTSFQNLDKQNKSIVAGIGFLKELELYSGNAAKGAEMLAVKQQQLENQTLLVKAAIGDAMVPAVSSLLEVFADFLLSAEGGISGLGRLASAFALIPKTAYAVAYSLNQIILSIQRITLGALEAVESLAKVSVYLKLPGSESALRAVTSSIEALKERISGTRSAMFDWYQRNAELDRQLDKMGKVTLDSVAKKIQSTAVVTNEASTATSKLRTETEKLLNPLETLVDKMGDQQKIGYTLNELVKASYKEVIKAAEEQARLGNAFSLTALKAWELALAEDALLSKSANFVASRQEIETALLKEAEILGKLANIKPRPIGVDDFLKPEVTISVGERWETIKGVAVEKTDQIRKQISTIFTDWSKGIADMIVDWKGLDSIIGMAKNTAKAILRAFIEELFSPFQNWLNNLAKGFGNWLSNLLSGKGAGGLGGIFGGLNIPGLSKVPGLGAILGVGGGIAGALAGGSTAALAATGATAMAGVPMAGLTASMTAGGPLAGLTAGAAGTGAGGAFMGSMIGLLTNPITIAAGVAAVAVPMLIKAFQGKTSDVAGSMEIARDFGGIQMGKQDFGAYYQSLGLTESTAYPIRKDISSAPAFLAGVLGPLSAAQGKTDEFLRSLENLEAFGRKWNFRDAFEVGLATGDWDKLNQKYIEVFSSSQELVRLLPDWRDKLLIVTAAADKQAETIEALDETYEKLGDTVEALAETVETSTARMAESTRESMSRAVDTVAASYDRMAAQAEENIMKIAASMTAAAAGSQPQGWQTMYAQPTAYTASNAADFAMNYVNKINPATGMYWRNEDVAKAMGLSESAVSTMLNQAQQLNYQWVTGAGAGTPMGSRQLAEGLLASMPQAQTGGAVKRTGLAVIHRGETITPAGGGVTINITGPVYGMDDLDSKIAESWRRVYRGGGFGFLEA